MLKPGDRGVGRDLLCARGFFCDQVQEVGDAVFIHVEIAEVEPAAIMVPV